MSKIALEQYGLVACLEVPGLQQVVEKADFADAAARVHSALRVEERSGELLRQKALHGFYEPFFSTFRKVLCLDRILLMQAFPEETTSMPSRELVLRAIYFLQACQNIFLRVFKEGFPPIGAIALGHFCFEAGSLAFTGPALIEADRGGRGQSWIGCVLTPSAAQFIREKIVLSSHALGPLAHVFLEEYPVPRRTGPSVPSFALNWGFPKASEVLKLEGDIRETLLHAAMAHGRQLSPEAFDQLNKTEAFLAFCKRRADFACGAIPDDIMLALPMEANRLIEKRGGREMDLKDKPEIAA